jgi:hypothetical protein
VQIDPNSQAPINSTTLSDNLNAPAESAGKRRSQKQPKATRPQVADVDVTDQQIADGASAAVIEATGLDAVVRRMRSGAYNTREVVDVIARRLLASGDL